MLAYMRLLTREAQKYGGTGWLTYDQVFRRNRTGVSASWDVLDPSLHIAYISARGDTAPVTPCSICSEVDHQAQDCALASLAPPTKRPAPATLPNDLNRSRQGKRPIRPSPQRRICLSWNRGKCLYEGGMQLLTHLCNMRGAPPSKRMLPYLSAWWHAFPPTSSYQTHLATGAAGRCSTISGYNGPGLITGPPHPSRPKNRLQS